jgi:hypothetical protein
MRGQEQIITEMGFLAQMAYQRIGEGKFKISNIVDNFNDENKTYKLKHEYKIINWIDTTISDLQAIFLEQGHTKDSKFVGSGDYIIAFRGTAGVIDLAWDFTTIPFLNCNPQYASALEFTKRALAKIADDKSCSMDEAKQYLTLTGHSLGGILTQTVGANLHIKGYAYNPWGVKCTS